MCRHQDTGSSLALRHSWYVSVTAEWPTNKTCITLDPLCHYHIKQVRLGHYEDTLGITDDHWYNKTRYVNPKHTKADSTGQDHYQKWFGC